MLARSIRDKPSADVADEPPGVKEDLNKFVREYIEIQECTGIHRIVLADSLDPCPKNVIVNDFEVLFIALASDVRL